MSYPRLDVAEGARARPVVLRARRAARRDGRDPRSRPALAAAAAATGDATLAWPAPRDPRIAIDDQEHDLSVLRPLLDAERLVGGAGTRAVPAAAERCAAAVGHGALGRAASRSWSHLDGLTRVDGRARAQALAPQRLTARAYSVSALQNFAACPYQFLLSAIYRLEPAEQPEPLQRLDPLTRGSIVHRMQAADVSARSNGAARCRSRRERSTPRCGARRTSIARVADEYRERLAPAIDRVWHEEIAVIARDLRGWLRTGGRRGRRLDAALLRAVVRAAAVGRTRSAQRREEAVRSTGASAARRRRPGRGAPPDRRAARHRSQDGQGPHEGQPGDRRRRDAAAGPLRGWRSSR